MISVAMATYNGAQYITEQLDSICNQSRKVDEMILVDDCSDDNTVEVVKNYIREHPECNIKLYENKWNLGFKKNFYKAMSLCTGDVIFLCDQDDIWMERKVETLCGILEAHDDVAVVSSAFIQIDSEGNVGECRTVYPRKMTHDEFVCVPLEDLIFHNISQGCSMAVKAEMKTLFLQYFNEEILHDWAMNLIAAIQKKCYYLNSPLFYYRIHDKNTIGVNDDLTLKRKNSLPIRTHDAVQAVKVLGFVENVDDVFYRENPWLEKVKSFSLRHIENLENKNFMGLLVQNFSPYYKMLKSFRGRLLDLFFCVK